MMLDLVPEWGIAIVLGLMGGLIRVVIGGTVDWPRMRRSTDGDKPGLELNSLGTLLAGGAAGFVLWALVGNQLFPDQGFGLRTTAATILAGLGGGDALMNYLNRRYGVVINQQANQETGAIAGPQARAIETLTQDLSDCQERERKLQEEVNRLRKGSTLDN